LRRRLIQRTCEAADAVAVLSPQWLAQLQPFCGGARLVVLPNAYDPGLEVAEVPAARDGGPVRFLHLGALNDRKGIGELIEAARRLDQDGVDFVLRLVGPATAADLARYRARVAAFGLEARVRFEGVVSGAAKRACLGDADVFVLASHHEGVPIALLEAAAAGLPLIATPAGATVAALTPSLEADGTPTRTPVAPIVPIGNPVKLAEVMARLAAEPGLRTRIARAAHHHVTTQYSSARFAQRLDLLYCSVLGRRVGAGSPGMRARFEVDDPAATWQADERGEALRPASPMPTEARRPAQPATSA
jgi:glycosyltransferase involved in cell wall biosynthesis